MENRIRFGRLETVLAAAVWALVLTSSAWADQVAARDLYKQALRNFRAGAQAEAIRQFKASEDADPTYPFPTLALARIYQELFDQETRHYEDAARAYERLDLLLRANPPEPKQEALYQAYYFQGLLYLKGGEYQGALDSLHLFLEVQPGFYSIDHVYNAIGIAQYYLDQYDLAVDSFRRALSADPDYAEARFNLRSVFTRLSVYNEALTVARTGELLLAMEKIQQLKEFAPRYLPGRRLEAKLYETMGRRDDALRVYGEILGVDAGHPITYQIRVAMAKLLRDNGERGEALALLRQNQRLFPDIKDERGQAEIAQMIQQLEAAE